MMVGCGKGRIITKQVGQFGDNMIQEVEHINGKKDSMEAMAREEVVH